MAWPLGLLLLLLSSSFCPALSAGKSTTAVEPLFAAKHPSQYRFPNPRLRRAYIALQTWKTAAIFSDPQNFTASWFGPNVCSYAGVFCAPKPTDSSLTVVAGVDLNGADIAGFLPPELALLSDLALLHLNSNRFCGDLPQTLNRLAFLYELDLSNNRFTGEFPTVVLSLKSLRYLDLRFNEFEGPIPEALFDLPLDAIFLNSNRFRGGIPSSLGSSPVSVVVLANNDLGGCLPFTVGKMEKTLNEMILLNDNLTGCIPPEVGRLRKITVFDVSFNKLQGRIPGSLTDLESIEQLDVGRNQLTGKAKCGGGYDLLCPTPAMRKQSPPLPLEQGLLRIAISATAASTSTSTSVFGVIASKLFLLSTILTAPILPAATVEGLVTSDLRRAASTFIVTHWCFAFGIASSSVFDSRVPASATFSGHNNSAGGGKTSSPI
ncbi:hypothetical protein HPP92_016401 [Vanilla planifolia]|uniref:Cell wall hydroxyproline-rich glycoprotein n=1 Tax=Vanilla planifolia TaxID=51239 RepID=A0A835QK05_VANPL|nr:hypothetical protein HPP92_016401 [Vanilla planifolia]